MPNDAALEIRSPAMALALLAHANYKWFDMRRCSLLLIFCAFPNCRTAKSLHCITNSNAYARIRQQIEYCFLRSELVGGTQLPCFSCVCVIVIFLLHKSNGP